MPSVEGYLRPLWYCVEFLCSSLMSGSWTLFPALMVGGCLSYSRVVRPVTPVCSSPSFRYPPGTPISRTLPPLMPSWTASSTTQSELSSPGSPCASYEPQTPLSTRGKTSLRSDSLDIFKKGSYTPQQPSYPQASQGWPIFLRTGGRSFANKHLCNFEAGADRWREDSLPIPA